MTHSLTRPFVPLFFFKLKQQSGNCPSPSGTGPWTGKSFLQKNIFSSFFKTIPKANPQPPSSRSPRRVSWMAPLAPL